MEHQLSHSFYLRKSKRTREKLCPIYLRITVNGHRIEDSVRRYIDTCYWIRDAGRLKKSNEENRQINLYLDSITARIHSLERQMIQDQVAITYDSFREAWEGSPDKGKMLLELFQKHNEQLEGLIKIGEAAPGTLDRYNTARDHVKAFIASKFHTPDISIKRLNYEFVSEYDFWLKTERHCAHNTSIKYISNLKKITNNCVRQGWLTRDPFLGYKLAKREVIKDPVTMEELKRLATRKFAIDRLNHVKDIFLFSCFTGLAYADVKKLTRAEIIRGQDREFWIITCRQKTSTQSRIPLLAFAAQLLDKYKDHPASVDAGLAFPVLSNQKMNAYLKEIADICEIQKPLTFHIARHTFATTVALENGIPMETVRIILGHKTIRTTQHYAKVTDKKVSEDMKVLRKNSDFIGNIGQCA